MQRKFATRKAAGAGERPRRRRGRLSSSRVASAPATLSAQGTRAAEELGSGAAVAAGKAKGMGEAPQQQTGTVGKKKKKSRRSSKGAKATEGDLRKRIPGDQRPSTSKKRGI